MPAATQAFNPYVSIETLTSATRNVDLDYAVVRLWGLAR
jgi:hypothetical protein